MIKVIAACVVGAAMAAGLALAGTSVAANAGASAEPVNEPLYNYGDR
ncbi:3-hydroxyacyl-CoA dehydrogenase [Lipingzhangella halophila]|uniref:3-hydroxyacyl-CoA dehydrogenase n=1 Tax=Lipingzhangella halophila TaxID=1783352 RepID=A0A7W7W476_9ACTN|nr:hypothetical protein [Lipingzhangella halophila]MBB4933837.1 3-hydroxyacyl-CoA dehydrogenase [Lipingzhangella halophila]